MAEKASKPKKEIIFEKAVQLFREMGYSAASMRALAERVGLQPSSFYSHFSSKEEILRQICFDNAHHFLEGMKQVEAQYEGPLARIRALIELHVQTAVENEASVFVFNDEWRHLQEPHLSDFLKLRKNYENFFKGIIERGMEEGVFIRIDPSIALNTILTSVRWIYHWHQPQRSSTSKNLAADISRLILGGLEQK